MSVELLSGHSPAEKTAYIAAIASIATSDNVASETEINYLLDLVDVAGLTDVDTNSVIAAAKDTSTESLKKSLDVLKGSDLRFSLVADLMAFAEADNNLAEGEKKHIADIAQYLGVNDQQVQTLNEYVREAAAQPAAMGVMDNAGSTQQGFLDNLGLGKKLQGAGINIGSIAKGLMAFVGPMVIGNLVSKGMNRSGGTISQDQGGGGLGSILGGLTGGKGFSGIGGFLSKLF